MPHRLREYDDLDEYRLKHDWTFDRLAAEMRKVGVKIPARTLHYLLKRSPRDARPLDRTLYKIRVFLVHIDPERTRPRRAAEPPPRRRRKRGEAPATAADTPHTDDKSEVTP